MRKTLFVALLALAACKGVETPTEANPEEVITTVELTIDGTVYTWSDPEQDGSPEVDPIELPGAGSWSIGVAFLNEQSNPVEDITGEVEAESDEHQVFFGTPSPLGYTYGDTDANGLPVGLAGTLEASGAGSVDLRVMLRHLPAEGGVPVKVDGLADTFADGGTLPGEADADVTFPVTVL